MTISKSKQHHGAKCDHSNFDLIDQVVTHAVMVFVERLLNSILIGWT
jgi:hypothetical protein